MNDVSGKQKLHLRLHPQGEDQWAIIDELSEKDEPELRRLLRPHAEMRFADNDPGKRDKESRRRLDVALGALTMSEIAYQIEIATFETEPVPQAESLKKLFQSEAFLRYANAYLYFGIRFLAWRKEMAPLADSKNVKGERTRTSNQRPFPLITPPKPVIKPSEPANHKTSEDKLGELIDLSSGCDPAIHRKDLTAGPQVRALDFLDGFTNDSPEDPNARSESENFELWLRGLYPEATAEEEKHFSAIRQGLVDWAIERGDFYLSLPSESEPPADKAAEGKKKSRPIGGWVVTNPLAARFALADIYWISRLLKAEVSANASVSYTRPNWLHLLRFRALLDGDEKETKAPGQEESGPVSKLEKAEEVLRSVFDFVCDLVQNAVEITEEEEKRTYEPELFPARPDSTAQWPAKWRKVFNEELNEIQQQRDRRFQEESSTEESSTAVTSPPAGGAGGGTNPPGTTDDDWMERIRKEKKMHNLIGLSFSGGGIRSATFNLGVLQGLQEFDLLRKIDFLSTVSGGGFIGSWLVANVCRTKHWLGRLMNWEESIDHLRRYSNYLAPRLGVFTADTWTMWASWARNAFLIQLTCLAWLWAALLLALLGHSVFLKCRTASAFLVAVGMMGIVWLTLVYNLSGRRAVSGESSAAKIKPWSERWVWSLAIVPAWIFSFLLASWMWAEAKSTAFQDVLQEIEVRYRIAHRAVSAWPYLIWLALGLLAFFTLSRLQKQNVAERKPQNYPIPKRLWHAAWASLLCVLVLRYELKGILSLFINWSSDRHQYSWYAYVLGPPLVLAAHTLSVVLFIGFCGRHSKEAIREWWTRFGAGLAMFGAAYLALTTAAVFGPPWTLYLFSVGGVKWGSIISWVGTVAGGVLAGKSSRTSGNGSHTKSPWLERLAKLGGLVFIVGAVLAASTALLYVILASVGAPDWNWIGYWQTSAYITLRVKVTAFLILLALGVLFSRFFEINIFGLNQFYQFRLVRCYLGATRWAPGFRKPQPFTNFDGDDDIPLNKLSNDVRNTAQEEGYRGPFPIFNCALNLSGSSDLALHTRHSASFSLTPLRCGADRPRVGYADTREFADGVMLGQAVAISGAAASPNMGFNTSPLVAFLLTMFNVRLGWWFPNPCRRLWNRPGLSFSLYYLLLELFGAADEKSKFVNVSDGGHFENLGIYELVRRRCKVIIACDAECDEFLQFGSLGNVVRLCQTDFGAKIDIDVHSIRQQKDGFSLAHCSVGTITYSNGSLGYLIYLKASMSGDEDVAVTQYRSVHPSFPHETTADQFFSEDQFESYRMLGQHILRVSLRGTQPGDDPVAIAETLADVLAPAGCSSEAFLKHTKTLDGIWERFRQTLHLQSFFQELIRQTVGPPQYNQTAHVPDPSNEETIIGLELIQLMENVFLDLRLDDFWSHPDNRGWAILFMRWARSPRFRAIWQKTRRTFGIRFEYFCEARLGLPRDTPIVRV
ncbi:MAG: patatin-like phospholipase family protein [Candidatus Sulfotelmatobacter sp.]